MRKKPTNNEFFNTPPSHIQRATKPQNSAPLNISKPVCWGLSPEYLKSVDDSAKKAEQSGPKNGM